MIKTVIIDDEKNCIELLQQKLTNYFDDIHIIGTSETVKSGIELIKNTQPDLVFLDIIIANSNAFELISGFEKINFEIIFTTAHNEYALKALKLSALDYLLKPIDSDELKQAVEKYKNKKKESNFSEYLKVFIENYSSPNNEQNKIVLPTLHGFDIVKLSDIIYCEADRNYTKFILINNVTKLVSKTIGQFVEQLKCNNFFRIHQSYLININHVEKYIKGNAPQVVMSNKDTLNVSKNKKDEFKKLFSAKYKQ
ncbi:MAG: hypothetical protein A2X08_02820 [Bacteroidetes bacterium GWA2_32_17]|nr:MAG: hypothetical protein A2X08_02820 [Bacteroidetes bacterium GWA2_32_17]